MVQVCSDEVTMMERLERPSHLALELPGTPKFAEENLISIRRTIQDYHCFCTAYESLTRFVGRTFKDKSEAEIRGSIPLRLSADALQDTYDSLKHLALNVHFRDPNLRDALTAFRRNYPGLIAFFDRDKSK